MESFWKLKLLNVNLVIKIKTNEIIFLYDFASSEKLN